MRTPPSATGFHAADRVAQPGERPGTRIGGVRGTVPVVWSARRRRELDEQDPALPLLPGEVSNGEFVPAAADPRDRWVVRRGAAPGRGVAAPHRRAPPVASSSRPGVSRSRSACSNACSGSGD